LCLYQYEVPSLTATLISFFQDGEEYVRKRVKKLVEVIGRITRGERGTKLVYLDVPLSSPSNIQCNSI